MPGDGVSIYDDAGANNIATNQIAIAAAATLIVAARASRRRVTIKTTGANSNSIGKSDVAANTGFIQAQNESQVFETSAAIYGFGIGGTTTCCYIEEFDA